MSYSKTEHILPIKSAALMDQEITTRVNLILRKEYQDLSSGLKRISIKTGIARNTIKRWYEGRNPPSAGHLIILAFHYPAILEMILNLSEYAHLVEQVSRPRIMPVEPEEAYVTLNVTTNQKPLSLNHRQLWFLNELRKGQRLTANSICQQWPVLLRTARRDIAVMKEKGLIFFRGAKKTGHYEITEVST